MPQKNRPNRITPISPNRNHRRKNPSRNIARNRRLLNRPQKNRPWWNLPKNRRHPFEAGEVAIETCFCFADSAESPYATIGFLDARQLGFLICRPRIRQREVGPSFSVKIR